MIKKICIGIIAGLTTGLFATGGGNILIPAFVYILGMTEKEVAFEIEKYMIKNGADGLAFDSIVSSPRRNNRCFYRRKTIKKIVWQNIKNLLYYISNLCFYKIYNTMIIIINNNK